MLTEMDRVYQRLKRKKMPIYHNPTSVPQPIGGYAHGVEISAHARLLFISGEIGGAEESAFPHDFEGQCHAIWQNILAILASAQMNVTHLVKVTTYLTDRSQVPMNGEIRRIYLGDHTPSLVVIIAQTLQPEWLLEIEATAASDG